jgi:hypothetical protein
LYATFAPKWPVGCPIVNSALLQLWCPTSIYIWTLYQVSQGIVKPKKDIVLRVRNYGVVRHRRLMELVKKPLKSLMRVVAHWVLIRVLRHSVL